MRLPPKIRIIGEAASSRLGEVYGIAYAQYKRMRRQYTHGVLRLAYLKWHRILADAEISIVAKLKGRDEITIRMMGGDLIVLTNNGNIYKLDSSTLSVVFGPLALPTGIAIVPALALEFSVIESVFFITTNTPTTGHAAYNAEGVEIWHIGTDGGLAFMGYLALLDSKLYRFVDDPEPLIMLQSRNAIDGSLINSIEFGAQTLVSADNVPIGLVSEGNGLFTLTGTDADPGPGFDYHLRRIDPVTLTTTASLLLGTFEANEVRPKSLGRGPGLLHVGWGHIGADQYATSYNLALAAVPASDYLHPSAVGDQGLQSDTTPAVFHVRIGSPDQMARHTFDGIETHASVVLESFIGNFLLHTDDAVL